MIARQIFRPSFLLPQTVRCLFRISPPAPATSPISGVHPRLISRDISSCPVRYTSASYGTANGGKKASARLAQVQRFLVAANERTHAAGIEPIPKITLNRVTVNISRSGGPGNQNVNEDHVTVNIVRSGDPEGQNVKKRIASGSFVNRTSITKVDMQFNVRNADWLSDRVKERIIQMEKNRINKDGELVISSKMIRTQKRNIEDALANLQVFMRLMKKFQAIIDAASYVPPPPSEETVKKITKLAAIGKQKCLDWKKAQLQKKAFRRSRDSWD